MPSRALRSQRLRSLEPFSLLSQHQPLLSQHQPLLMAAPGDEPGPSPKGPPASMQPPEGAPAAPDAAGTGGSRAADTGAPGIDAPVTTSKRSKPPPPPGVAGYQPTRDPLRGPEERAKVRPPTLPPLPPLVPLAPLDPLPQEAEGASGSRAADAGSPVSEATPAQPLDTDIWWSHRGRTYVTTKKVPGGKEVNGALCVEDVQEYVQGLDATARWNEPSDEVPFESVEDFILTMKMITSEGNKHFRWPSERISLQKTLSVALHHMPPGTYIPIRSALPIPDLFLAEPRGAGGSRAADPGQAADPSTTTEGGGSRAADPALPGEEQPQLGWEVHDVYHGTSVFSALEILDRGFMPSLGAGCDALQACFGVPVPGVYVAPNIKVATYYPMTASTCPQPEDKNGVGGGSLISLDGTPPVRVVFRCLAHKHGRLWKRDEQGNKNPQQLYRPSHLHITHIYIYSVAPRLIHKCLLDREVTMATSTTATRLTLEADYEPTSLDFSAEIATVPEEAVRLTPATLRLACKSSEFYGARLLESSYHQTSLIREWFRKRIPRVRVGIIKKKLDELVPFLSGGAALAADLVARGAEYVGRAALEVPLGLLITAHPERGEVGRGENISVTLSGLARASDPLPLLPSTTGSASEPVRAFAEAGGGGGKPSG